MEKPIKLDQYAPYNGSSPVAAGASPHQPGSSGGPAGWLKAVMERPRFTIALGIVLLYILMLFLFLYTFMGHIMFINIPPPDPVPQFVIDSFHQMGHEWPTPTPAPEYITGTDAMNSSNYIMRDLVIAGILVLASWPIIALALHLLTKIFGGVGRYFPDMVSAIGYTYVPKVLAVIGMILIVTQLPVIKIDASQNNINDLVQYIDSTALPALAKGLSLASLLCSCLLGVVAVRYNSRIGWVAATLVVGVPLVLYLAFTYL